MGAIRGWPGSAYGPGQKRGPVAPSVRVIFGDMSATPAVLTVLMDTRVGRMTSMTPRGEKDSEGVEGGPALPRMYS